MAQTQPAITVFLLAASRSIRPVWVLEELGLPYTLEMFSRVKDTLDRAAFDVQSAAPVGRYPVLRDGALVLPETGAIVEYLCDNYDREHRLVPADPALRARTLVFVHAAEGTLMLHAMALRYFRTHTPATLKEADPAALAVADAKLAAHAVADLDWLARELVSSGGPFLIGDTLSAADIMLAPCVHIVLRVGALGRSWPGINAWLRRCEATAGYKRMVERTGYAESG